MTVSMDGLRRNAINSYNNIIAALKKAQDDDGQIIIHPTDIEEDFDDLRECLVFLACSYQEGSDGWEAMKNPKIDSLTD